MEIAYLIGNPEEVDLNSLKKTGPVGIEVACRMLNRSREKLQFSLMERVIE
jgi:hypothetical protein